MPQTQPKRFSLLFIFLVCLNIIACGSTSESNGNTKKPEVEEVSQAPEPDFNGTMPGEPGYIPPDAPKVVIKETFEDIAKWTVPRVQFFKELKGDNTDTIWTQNYDGSDKRQVVDAELIATIGNGFITGDAIRSPNMRYIATSYVSKEKKGIAIFDLKNQSAKLAVEGYHNFLNWFPDSERLMFNLEGQIKTYNLTTDTLNDAPSTRGSEGFTLMPDGQRIFVQAETGYVFLNLQGEVIESHTYPSPGGNLGTTLSPDRKRLIMRYSSGKGYYINLDNGEVLWEGSFKEIFGPDVSRAPKFTHRQDEVLLPGSTYDPETRHVTVFKRFYNFANYTYKDIKSWPGTNLEFNNTAGGLSGVIIPPHLLK